jgi:hypothetical protein
MLVLAAPATAAQVDLELFAPTREALRAIEAARRARAGELAGGELRLADLYLEDAMAALNPSSGPPDTNKATRLAHLSAAQARVAETRAIEVVREREAAAAGSQYLDALEPDPMRLLPPRPPAAVSAAEYSRLQREARAARAARRAAEEARDKLLSPPR